MRKLPFCVEVAVEETGAARFVSLFVRVFVCLFVCLLACLFVCLFPTQQVLSVQRTGVTDTEAPSGVTDSCDRLRCRTRASNEPGNAAADDLFKNQVCTRSKYF